MNKGPLDGKFKKVMALKWEHKKQILVMNNCQFYCFYVKSVLAKRIEKSFCSRHTSLWTYVFFFPHPPKEIWRVSAIFTPPPPPHGASSEYIPRVFHFHTCSREDLSTAINKHNILCPQYSIISGMKTSIEKEEKLHSILQRILHLSVSL